MRFVLPPWAQPLRRRERIQRAILLVAIITAHLLFLLWLVTRQPKVRLVRDPGRDLILISVSSGQRVAIPTALPKLPPPIVVPTPPIIVPSPLPTPSGEINPAAAEGGAFRAGEAGGCALASRTADAIAKDPAAMAELAALPPAFRTSADAVMLWNGVWLESDPASIALPVTPLLRRAVERAVAEASPECQAAVMNGPQFLAVPEQNRTTTLVIGSGTWRWSDLLKPSVNCLPSPIDACLAPSAIP